MFIKQTAQWGEVAKEAYKLKKKRTELQQREKELLDKLKELSDYESSTFGEFRFQKIERKGLVDLKAVQSNYAIDLEPFRGASSEAWKLFKY